jgi:hypothetical protein
VRGGRGIFEKHGFLDAGFADEPIDPSIGAMALGAMVARFAELWLVQDHARYDFDRVVERLTRLWCNALGLEMGPSTRSS